MKVCKRGINEVRGRHRRRRDGDIYVRCWRDISTCRGPRDKTTLVSGMERKLIWPEVESRGYDVQEGLEGQAENTRD